MKKILIVTILKGCAVDKLAEMIRRYNPHLDIKVFPFHGKRFDQKDLEDFKKLIDWADLIDFEYWKSFQVLYENYPLLLKDKKKIITHHNPYDLDKIPQNLVDAMVVKNHYQEKKLKGSVLIQHAVDFNLMKFNENYNADDKVVGMVAFRIESSKGILEVAKVCKKLGYHFLLVGHISDINYYQQIVDTGVSIETRLDISEEDLYRAYCDMTILVCNSKDNFESGPMPVLEAMAVGVPVLSRNVGIVQDIYNNQNLLLREGQRSDVEDLERQLKVLMETKETRMKLIRAGFDTVKNFSAERMAFKYAMVYNDVLFPEHPLVSIITPVRNRKKQIAEIMEALKDQEYQNIEFVCCDDGSNDGLKEDLEGWAKNMPYPVKYVATERLEGYNIATARNIGITASQGKYCMFLDSRFIPEKDAIKLFVEESEKLNPAMNKIWYFGNKGSNKKAFVENFSFIFRRHIIKGGMFNERINLYGGQSQELRERFDVQGFEFKYLENVRAQELLSANKWQKRTGDIIKMKDLIYKLNI